MKPKLVLWGADAEEKRVLIAMELKPEENKVNIWTFPESIASDEFADQLMREWRDGGDVPFPEGFTKTEKELTVTETLLPADLKVERTDLIQRAQTEWHFIVLSTKMSAQYASELEDLKARVNKLEKFDSGTWEELKAFWDKVQNQVRDRNLFREHADTLRDNTNALFNQMKELRSSLDNEFRKTSQEVHDRFMKTLDEFEKRLEKGSGRLQNMFEELKSMQRDFRDAVMSKDHRADIWERLDNAFKTVKVKRFGAKAVEETNPSDRVQHRYDGLLEAIEKMERSIKRDQDDLNFQRKKIDTTDGQLEAQIRQAKIMMIEERIRSKEDKLHEMMATKTDLESKLESLKVKEAQRLEREKLEAAKEAAKEKIAEDIKHAAEERIGDTKIEKAAEAISASPPPKQKKSSAKSKTEDAKPKEEDSILEVISESITESLEDVVDTFKAVASVVSDKIEDAVDDLKEKFESKADESPSGEPAAEGPTTDDTKKEDGVA